MRWLDGIADSMDMSLSACLSSCSRSDRPLVELSVEPAGFSGRCTGVSVPLRVVPSSTGLPSTNAPGKAPNHIHTTLRWGSCHSVNNSKVKGKSIPPQKTRRDSLLHILQVPCDPSQKWRGSLTFLPPFEMRPSSIAPNPVE